MSLLHSDEGRRAARLLEFDRLLAEVAEHCVLERGAELVRALDPLTDAPALEALWQWVEELRQHSERGEEVGLGSFSDLDRLIGEQRTHGGPLGGEELAAVAGAARALSVLLSTVAAHSGALPRTSGHLEGARDPRPIADHLGAALEPDGRLKDGASPRLGSLRRAAAAAEARVRESARRAMGDAVARGWTNGPELVLRGSRYCVPLRSNARRKVPGIVHDRSDSGQTLFVEPMAVVEAGNELAEARLAAEDEERRILVALNRDVAAAAPALLDLFRRAVALDAVRARMLWGRRWKGHAPRLGRDARGTIRLDGFRHPLLLRSLEVAGRGGDLVPLELSLEDGRIPLISGPNAGGKTVALKSVALAVFLAQSGIPLPVDHPPVLPVFDHVLVDLGDEQSIADALSSFSAHLSHLRRILELATSDSLVLLDEIGGGTDPQEGVVLARSVLELLAARRCRTLATTHYGQLKALVEEDERFRHASMAYDPERLVPRFELVLDRPGSSHALGIAERMGLPAEMMERARALLGDERLQLDALLLDLERERAELASARQELVVERDQAGVERRRYERLARELKEQRRDLLDRAEREAEGIVRNARRRVENLLQRIREAGGGQAAVEAANEARRAIEERAENLRERQQQRGQDQRRRRPLRIEEGELVRHAGLGQVGRIVEVRGGRVTLDVAGTRVVAGLDQLVAPDAEEIDQVARHAPQGTVRTELVEASLIAAGRVDVRGQDSEEAWAQVDRALDRCLLAGMRSLEVVHGKGTGRLRRVLGERLARDPRVRRAAVGDGGRLDDGVTFVEL